METEIIYDDNGKPKQVVTTTTTKKGKQLQQTYALVPVDNLRKVGECLSRHDNEANPYPRHYVDASKASFRTGYLRALIEIDWTLELFPDLPEAPSYFRIPNPPTKKIKIGTGEYYEHEVIERLAGLPTVRSVHRS